MNVSEMIRRTRTPLRDPGASAVPDDDIVDWLNDAYVDLASRLEVLVRTKTGTTSGATLAIPDGSGTDPAAVRILSLTLGTDDQVEFTDAATWQSHKDGGTSPPRTLGRLGNDGASIELYPTPTTGTSYSMRYVWIPSGTGTGTKLLDDPTDEPKLPKHLHRKMVIYAQAQGKLALGEYYDHDRLMALYEQGLPPPPVGKALIFIGPDSILPTPGPFDRPRSKHI